MKKVAPDIWRDMVEGIEIMVNENLKTKEGSDQSGL